MSEPQQTLLGETISPQQQLLIKEQVQQHLNDSGTFGKLKTIVAAVLGRPLDGGADTAPGGPIAAAHQRAVLAQIVAAHAGGAQPTLPSSDPRRAFLHVLLLGGRAFAQAIEADEAPGTAAAALPMETEEGGGAADGAAASAAGRFGSICACLQFGAQRFRSKPVPLTAEPELRDGFLVELPLPDETALLAAAAESLPAAATHERLRGLARLSVPMHLVLLRVGADGRETLLSSVIVEWRKALHAGKCTLSLELPGIGEQASLPVGVLELKLEVLPLPPAEARLTEAEALASIKRERDVEVDAERRFFAYARGWWAAYLDARPDHRLRPVKIFAMSELGTQRPVTAYVRPLRADRLLESPMQAAHFVSLIRHERAHAASGAGAALTDVWRTNLATLATKAGDTEEHAVLLCCLLLGFGLDAFVCVGTDARGPHTWVMTRDGPSRLTFWESLTAQRFEVGAAGAAPHPYVTLASVFSHEAFYANAQPETSLRAISLDLDEASLWKPMDRGMLRALAPLPIAPLSPPTLTDHGALERRLEAELRAEVDTERAALGLASGDAAWDSHLSYLLAPALLSYENERVSGTAIGAHLFQQAVRRAVPEGHTFKGFPLHFTSPSAAGIAAAWRRSEVATGIMRCAAPGATLGLRLRVFPMADDVCSVWAMLAVAFKP